jgi:hypothetical protein
LATFPPVLHGRDRIIHGLDVDCDTERRNRHTGMAFSRDSERLATTGVEKGNEKNKIRIWDLPVRPSDARHQLD